MGKQLNELIMRVAVFLHNFSYRLISKYAILLNNNIHPKHRILNYHKFFIDNVSKRDTVLDIGCGNGFLSYDISKKAKEVMGIDIDKNSIEFAKRNYRRPNLSFIIGDATKYRFNKNFDVIVLSNVLEHIKDRIEFLKKLRGIAPKILIRVPLITRSWLAVYLKEKGYRYKLDSTHFIEYTEEQIIEELKKSGLRVKDYYIKWGEWYGICKSP